jgi:hypothetical protein
LKFMKKLFVRGGNIYLFSPPAKKWAGYIFLSIMGFEQNTVLTPQKGNNYLVKDGEVDIAEINVKNVAGDYILVKYIKYDEDAESESYHWVEATSFTFLAAVNSARY